MEREAYVKEGVTEKEGRIDLLLHFGEPERLLLGVEVKAWDESYEKQRGYRKSLRERCAEAECVLVAVPVVPAESRYEFGLRCWRHIAVALRREIARYVEVHDRNIIAAMMCAFVAAIEQNLVELSTVVARRAWAKQPTLLSESLREYLHESLNEVNRMISKTSSGSELFMRGAEYYLDALAAIAAFRGEVQNMCRDIYRHHARELAVQMGLDERDCEDHADDDADERWAEVCIYRLAQQDCYFYLYLSWGEGEHLSGMATGTVFLDLYHKHLRDEIFEGFRRKKSNCRVEKYETYSLVLTQGVTDLSTARDILDALVSEWLDYCKAIGGLKLRNRKTI